MANTRTKFVPGPNVYNIKSKVGEAPAFFMGEKTGSSLTSGTRHVPGPGAYQPVNVTHVSSAYSMASKSKSGMQIAVQPETGGHTKIASMSDPTPGAGTYQPKDVIKNHHTGPKFGTDSRKGLGNAKGGLTPGPNAYPANNKNTVMRSAPAFGFGTSRRPQSVNVNQKRPGPGTYEAKGIIGTETQGRTLASKLSSSKSGINPGPGQYTPMFT